MLKNISKLELQIANKIYSLFLDSDSPLEHVKECLFQFQAFVAKIEEQAKAQQAQAAAEQPLPAPSPEPDIKPAE